MFCEKVMYILVQSRANIANLAFFFFFFKQDLSEKGCWKRLSPYSGDSFFTSLHCAHMLVSPFWIITSWTSYPCIKSISDVITSIKSFLSCFLTVNHVRLCLTWLSMMHCCQCGVVVICSHLPQPAAHRGLGFLSVMRPGAAWLVQTGSW